MADTLAPEVEFICPPIPTRAFDYAATMPGYEPGQPIGRGSSPEAALRDLAEKMEDR